MKDDYTANPQTRLWPSKSSSCHVYKLHFDSPDMDAFLHPLSMEMATAELSGDMSIRELAIVDTQAAYEIGRPSANSIGQSISTC